MFSLMHRLITAATSLLVVAALIGCEKGVDSPKLPSQAQNQDSTVDPSAQLEQTPASSNTTENSSDDQAPALAVEPYEIEGIEVSLLKVQRASGKTLNVYWKMTNQSSEDKTLVKCSTSWYCKYQLAAGTFGDGIYIIDSANQKKHMVLKADKKPVVSAVKTPLKVSPGSSIRLWAKFPAPPADIRSVSIYLPGVAPMEDIPISE
tara:strand:- start:270 stop:884 length:615 start_codon:yes stop_codon:yes gene_type:complete